MHSVSELGIAHFGGGFLGVSAAGEREREEGAEVGGEIARPGCKSIT